MTPIRFYRDFDFEYEVLETVSPLVRRIVARNPGSFTGPGTGTYVVGRGRVAVIDPGPAMSSHTGAILRSLRGETVDSILITHSHVDHWPGMAEIQRATGARTYGFGSQRDKSSGGGPESSYYGFITDQAIEEGDTLEGPGWHLTALHTPGHASDHLCFALAEEKILFSGDHVMGWSTSVIMPPDGDMADYMRSLERLLDRDDATYLPTHGPPVTDPKPYVRSFLTHRRERRAAILQQLTKRPSTISEIVEAVYVDVSPSLHGAAAQSVLAHLIELQESGEVAGDGRRYRLAR
jgi:glyoxylase-like metal-dependent hydrolase (beta-lactamase superfamily II)